MWVSAGWQGSDGDLSTGGVGAPVSLVWSSLIENPMFRRLVCYFCDGRLGKAYRERYRLVFFECFTVGHGQTFTALRDRKDINKVY